MERVAWGTLVWFLLVFGGCGDSSVQRMERDAGLTVDGSAESTLDAGRDAAREVGLDASRAIEQDAGADAQRPTRSCHIGGSECDFGLQDCPAGQGCYPSLEDEPYFVGVCLPAGSAEDGEVCGGSSGCRPGLACTGASPDRRRCRPFCCDGDDSWCGGEGRCFSLSFAAPLGVCHPTDCDVLRQLGCFEGTACYVDGSWPATRCAREGTASQGQSCERDEDCLRGHLCLASGECARMCDASASPLVSCEEPATCSIDLTGDYPASYGAAGLCVTAIPDEP